MKSLEFFKPTLATTLAIVLAWLLCVRPAQAGYILTLQQVGPDVVATGSGLLDLRGLTFEFAATRASGITGGFPGGIVTGGTTGLVNVYRVAGNPLRTRLGGGGATLANSGSGDLVGILCLVDDVGRSSWNLAVPRGYLSGTALSDSATYRGKTFATLGVAPSTRVWTWGTGANQNFTLQIGPAFEPAVIADFNNDSHPDFVLRNARTGQTAIWFLNNNVFVSGAFGPTLPVGWELRGAADFNLDRHSDFGLCNSSNRQTAIWDLSGPTVIGSASGPTPPSGWALALVADFNGDGKPDYLLYNAGTSQTAIWYLNNNVFVGQAAGPTLPPGWTLVGVADFNGDGHPDYALFNIGTGQTALWYLSGPTFIGSAFGPTLPSGWQLVAGADFDNNGKRDYLLYNAGTRQTAIWYLNNNAFVSGAFGPTLPAGYSLLGP